MSWSIDEVSNVRVLAALVSTARGGQELNEPGFAEVVFQSTAAGQLHQAYVDGQLAGCTLSASDRTLRVPVVDAGPAVVVVVAVNPADRLTDFAEAVAAAAAASPSQVTLTWSGGSYLGDGLQHFDIYDRPVGGAGGASGGAASADDERPLNGEPIPPTIDGEVLSGWGRGGFGRGGFGRSAMRFAMTTPRLTPGEHLLEVAAVDRAGRRTLAALAVNVAGYVRPPHDVKVQSYDAVMRSARIVWQPSEDFILDEEA